MTGNARLQIYRLQIYRLQIHRLQIHRLQIHRLQMHSLQITDHTFCIITGKYNNSGQGSTILRINTQTRNFRPRSIFWDGC